MSECAPIPEGCEGLIAHLFVNGGVDAIAFYEKAFGAEVVHQSLMPGSGKLLHAQLQVGGSRLFLADDFPEFGQPARAPSALGGSSATVHRYVEDVDGAVERAAAAGATVVFPPMDMFWGARYGIVVDPFGHQWSFAKQQQDLTPEEIDEAGKAFFANMGDPCSDDAS